MNVSLKPTMWIVFGALCALLIGWAYFRSSACRESRLEIRNSNTCKVDPGALEREIRIDLPIGSSLPTVESYLRNHAIDFGYDVPTNSVVAIVRNLKGSTLLANGSLSIQFRFDDSSKLKVIDAKVRYTGL
jgi:hypothetical protein